MSRKKRKQAKGKSAKPTYECPASRSLARAGQPLAGFVQKAKGALVPKHRRLVKPRVDCSIHLETACAAHQNEGEQIYDYLLVLAADCDAHYVEVHPASSTGTVQEMIHKKKGTAAILVRMGVRPDGTWHWIVPSKGKVCFKASDAYGKRLAAAGIRQPRRAL